MIPKELAKKIRYIQIYTSKAVNDSLAGEYESVFKGRGMEFDEVREYQIGDEIRSIDWNVTARMGEPYVKLFVEERELTVIFLVDLSASGAFGSTRRIKNEVAAEICALLAFSAIKNNDKVGLIVFTDQIEMFIPPAKGSTHVLRLIRELLNFTPRQTRTDISAGIEYLGRVTNKKSVVFLISDFLGQGFEKQMRVLGKRHDLIAVSITDPREVKMPSLGLIQLEDAETGEQLTVDTGNPQFRRRFYEVAERREATLQENLKRAGVDLFAVSTEEDLVRAIVRMAALRKKRRR